MRDVLVEVLPIILMFLAGTALRAGRVFDRADADRFLETVVWVGLPALILLSIGRVELTAHLALLPTSAALTILATYPVVRLTGGLLRLPARTLAVFMVGPMIMNMSVLYPFALAVWGEAGFARLALFDIGNALLVLTLVYAIAARYGPDGGGWRSTAGRLAAFPPLWALAAALVLNVTGLNGFSQPLTGLLELAGGLMVPLLMLALGIYFEPRLLRPGPLWLGIFLRAGLGLALGLTWVSLFELRGLDRAVVLLGTLAPVGFNTLVFAHREDLDRPFASSLASVSMLLALIYLPVVLFWLS